MTKCIKCKTEYDDDGGLHADEEIGDGCDSCDDTEALFRAWCDIADDSIYKTATDTEFDEDIYEKYPILTDDGSPRGRTCKNVYHLEWWLMKRLQRILIDRQKDYKRKKEPSGWGRWSSTPIWKKDTTGKRKAPLVSATCFDIGEKMKGKAGIMYVVKRKKDGSQFWVRYRGR